VIPVFGLVLCGWGAGRARLVGAESSDALNQFAYYFALPIMLFAAVSLGSLRRRRFRRFGLVAGRHAAGAQSGTSASSRRTRRS